MCKFVQVFNPCIISSHGVQSSISSKELTAIFSGIYRDLEVQLLKGSERYLPLLLAEEGPQLTSNVSVVQLLMNELRNAVETGTSHFISDQFRRALLEYLVVALEKVLENLESQSFSSSQSTIPLAKVVAPVLHSTAFVLSTDSGGFIQSISIPPQFTSFLDQQFRSE